MNNSIYKSKDKHINERLVKNCGKFNSVEDLEKLIIVGAEVHYKDELPLKQACASGNLEIVKHLVEKYKCNIHNNNDEAFMLACDYGHLDIVTYLYHKGANLFALEGQALRWAKESEHDHIVKFVENKMLKLRLKNVL